MEHQRARATGSSSAIGITDHNAAQIQSKVKAYVNEMRKVTQWMKSKKEYTSSTREEVDMLYFKFIQLHESIRQSGDAKDIVSRWKTFKGDYILEQLFEIYKPIRTTHLEELRAKQQEKQEAQINQLILRAHTLTAEYASSAKKKYDEQGKLFGNMVSVVMDLSTGDFAKGRAAHGKNQTTLHHRIVAILPTESANAFVAQTYGNCSEVDALDKLLKKCPSTKLENLYFSSAKPDNQKLIPPCANCQRWIKKVGAKAWEGVAL